MNENTALYYMQGMTATELNNVANENDPIPFEFIEETDFCKTDNYFIESTEPDEKTIKQIEKEEKNYWEEDESSG